MSEALPRNPCSLVEVDSVSYELSGSKLLNGVSLHLKSGELRFLRGENGAGKTTFLEVLCGLRQYSTGKIKRRAGLKMRLIGHRALASNALTVSQNLNFLRPEFNNAQISAALRTFGIERFAFRRADRLSAGQKRKMVLASLVDDSSDLWLLDEPYTSLDLESQQTLNKLIEEHASRGGSVLLTSHGEPSLDGLQHVRLHRGQLQWS